MSVTRIFDLLPHLAQAPSADCLNAKVKGQWVATSTESYISQAGQLAAGLLAMGLQKGDRVAMIANNRPEWNITDMGILSAGMINVPMYPTISEADYKFILNDAEVKVVFVSDKELFRKVQSVRAEVPSLMEVYAFEEVEGAKSWKEVLQLGQNNPAADQLKSIQAGIQPDDLATIIYTSGTTGNPKGVMLSHHNIMSNMITCQPLCTVEPGDVVLSFLPLCHVFERMLVYMYQYQRAHIYYAESMDTIGDNIREVKPVMFTAVPRLLEKVYDRIVAKGNEQKGIKKVLFFWALNLALKYEYSGGNGAFYTFKLGIARKLVFSKWREGLGGRIKSIVSGSAPLQPRLNRVFNGAGIKVLEGYGLTETSPVVSVNRMQERDARFGTVGPVIDDVQVRIAEDGEILVKGPNVMLGYYKRPDLTAEVIDADGWFHTGDIGMLEEGRFLKITDRKKEMFKTSGGKYVAPQLLENKFKESPFIEQVMVVGDARKFPGALIVPAFAYLKDWCKSQQLPCETPEQMVTNDKVRQKLWEQIAAFNKEFGKTEQVKKIKLLPKEWSVESGELTPTMKLKRKVLNEKYKQEIESIYAE
ncbi:MAG: long-chain fatty acid--CoA ligase [Flavobacteriales bacterium]|nr:long-chain fatty acid--CoA ligase [Flavobacteriales bacterium]